MKVAVVEMAKYFENTEFGFSDLGYYWFLNLSYGPAFDHTCLKRFECFQSKLHLDSIVESINSELWIQQRLNNGVWIQLFASVGFITKRCI